MLTRKNAPSLTNLLTKFHDDRKINVTSRPRPRGVHVFQPTGIIFELVQDIIGMNLLTELHEDRTINVATREKCPAPWKPCFSSKHKSSGHISSRLEINVASRMLTRKNAPPPGGHVFQPTGIIFELFHEDWTINVASRVNNAPPLGSNVFRAKVTIFELIQDISGTNLLSKFHEDQKINVAYRKKCPGGHVFQPTGIFFELVQDIIGMNLLTKFYEDQTITVATRPLGSYVFQANVTIFELIQDIIKTKNLTKFHEDWTINVASRELTRQMLTPHNAQRTTDGQKAITKAHMSTLCSAQTIRDKNELGYAGVSLMQYAASVPLDQPALSNQRTRKFLLLLVLLGAYGIRHVTAPLGSKNYDPSKS
ncbi:hypothetical protein DPMN_069674 [Dreissena polymorpha]|uniref:Uncharacterized protein n=1 Tax=Dreissena polymorpha TaxID=45954 RepID=A0A9D3Z4S2_DREPO|nr:hypothetical protein DPMN_069674 [Dreissena polymorpha]